MANGHYKESPIESYGEKGLYNKGDWLREAELHLLSAQMLRRCSDDARPVISGLMNSENRWEHRGDLHRLISQREAGNKSSILLIGYAFEMLLKAGLVCLYVGVPRQDLCRDMKGKYGHRLRYIAEEIETPLDGSELGKLDLLSKWVIGEARYPVTPCDENSCIEQWNGLVREFWDEAKFEKWLALYEKTRLHVWALDASSDDPMIWRRWEVDDDGYVTYRIGGKLRPRITVHYSSVQKDNGNDNKKSLKTQMLASIDGPLNRYLMRDWDTAAYREIK